MGSNACRRKFKDWRSAASSSMASAQAAEIRSRDVTSHKGKNVSKNTGVSDDEEPTPKRARGRAKSGAGTSTKRK